RRIGQEADLIDALLQLVEHGNAAFDECATILGWRDALGAAIEETDAEGDLHVGDRLGYGWLCGADRLRGFRHASRMCDREEDPQFSRAEPARGEIVPFHRGPLYSNHITLS